MYQESKVPGNQGIRKPMEPGNFDTRNQEPNEQGTRKTLIQESKELGNFRQKEPGNLDKRNPEPKEQGTRKT